MRCLSSLCSETPREIDVAEAGQPSSLYIEQSERVSVADLDLALASWISTMLASLSTIDNRQN